MTAGCWVTTGGGLVTIGLEAGTKGGKQWKFTVNAILKNCYFH